MRKLINIAFFMVAVMFIFNLAGCSSWTNDSKMHKQSMSQEIGAQPGTKAEQKAIVRTNTKKTTITQTQQTAKKSDSLNTNTKPVTKKEVPKTTLVQPIKTLQSKQASKNSTAAPITQAQTKIQIMTRKQAPTQNQTKTPKQAPTQAQTKIPTQAQTITKTQTVSKTAPPIQSVSLYIIGPKDRGIIMKKTKVIFKKGDTILKVLLQATKNHHIDVDYSGSRATAYINGIDNIYEFDYGAKSGWVGKQNGKNLTKSADAILVKDGDQLEFLYTH